MNLSLADTAPENLPEALKAALPAAEAAAQANIDRAKVERAAELTDNLRQLKEVLETPVSNTSRVIRLRHLASERSRIMTDYAACKKGCSHCCHISTMVPKGEAQLIAKAIKRPLATPATVQLLDGVSLPPGVDTYLGKPCTFLVAGACSIYEHRPMVCRSLLNMDESDLLCQLVPGTSVPVPYLNTMDLQMAFIMRHIGEPYADIREWFPPDESSAP